MEERIILAQAVHDSTVCDEWALALDNRARRLVQTTKLSSGLPQKGNVRATYWGITLRQIGELLVSTGFLSPEAVDCNFDLSSKQGCLKPDMLVRDFVQEYVIPMTAGTGMGYALMVNENKPLEIQIMVSHTWQEGILEMYYALRTSIVDYDAPLFVCFLSLYQNNDESAGVTITQQLGPDATLGPFAEVINNFKDNLRLRISLQDLKEIDKFEREQNTPFGYLSKPNMSCGFTLVVPTKYCNIYSRMWCCLELFTCINMGVPIFSTKLSSGILNDSVSSKDARCGPPGTPMNSDERSIRKAIDNGVGYWQMDEFISSFTAIHSRRRNSPFPHPEPPEITSKNKKKGTFLKRVLRRRID